MLYGDCSAPQINELVNSRVVLLPLGAIEQHGPHLAVSTDTDQVTAIARAAEQRCAADVLLCPTLPFGASHHHLSLGGTLSVAPALYTNILVDLVGSLLDNGFRRIVLLNGHGGNITPGRQALSILSARYDATLNPNIALANYWELAGTYFAGNPRMTSPALSHACEYETSLMLHLYPGKVFPDRIERATRPASNGYIPWEDDEPYRGVSMVKATRFISGNGSSGEPQLATAEKGAWLFGHAVDALVQFIDAFKSWPFAADLTQQPVATP